MTPAPKNPTIRDRKEAIPSTLAPSPSGGGLGWGVPTHALNATTPGSSSAPGLDRWRPAGSSSAPTPSPALLTTFSRPIFSRSSARGLSLVQLMVVIFIIGLLMAMTVGGISGMKNANAASSTKATIAVLDASLDEIKSASGEYPRIYGSLGALTGASEVGWVNSAVTQLTSLPQTTDMFAKLGRFKEVHNDANPFGTDLTNFRNVTNTGIPLPLNSADGTVSGASVDTLRGVGGTFTILRDGWDRPIFYFPSATDSDTAATLRPLFVSAGRDGKIQSTPWKSGTWSAGATVLYKSKWYVTPSGASTTPGTDATWQEVTCDDFVTRGN
jgi:type II secretory pathway pseudopilin PulG